MRRRLKGAPKTASSRYRSMSGLPKAHFSSSRTAKTTASSGGRGMRLTATAPAPGGGTTTSQQGRPRTVFARALQTGNLVVAEGMARELGRNSLAEALELTALVARKDPRRHPRVAVRWVARYVEEFEPTLNEIALVVGALSALTGERHAEALRVLRAMVDSF